MDPRLIAKIGLEFLALHVGKRIYGDDFGDMRRFIGDGSFETDSCRIELLRSRTTRPLHGLLLEQSDKCVVVQVRLFGSLAYRFILPSIAYIGPRMVYTEDLSSGDETLSWADGNGL